MEAMKLLVSVIVALLILGCACKEPEMPYWLSDYEEVYNEDPLKASRQWFKDAKMGLLVHFNIANLMEFGDLNQDLLENGDQFGFFNTI
jgi:hypothetical protein